MIQHPFTLLLFSQNKLRRSNQRSDLTHTHAGRQRTYVHPENKDSSGDFCVMLQHKKHTLYTTAPEVTQGWHQHTSCSQSARTCLNTVVICKQKYQLTDFTREEHVLKSQICCGVTDKSTLSSSKSRECTNIVQICSTCAS